jgi:ABC-type transport system involved in multi-copper enzyme maturation permease subunit
LLLRTERANVFFGRFLGTLVFTLAMLAILIAVIFLYLALKAKFYPTGEVALWLIQGYVALALFSLPYIALCSWISASIDSPFISLVVCELIIFGIPAFVALTSRGLKGIKYLDYLTPWPLKYQLLHPDALHVLGAALAMFAFTGVLLWLGMRTFQTRDL